MPYQMYTAIQCKTGTSLFLVKSGLSTIACQRNTHVGGGVPYVDLVHICLVTEFAFIWISPVTHVTSPVRLLVESTPPEHSVPFKYVIFFWLNQLLSPILFSYPILYMLYFHAIMIPDPTGFSAY